MYTRKWAWEIRPAQNAVLTAFHSALGVPNTQGFFTVYTGSTNTLTKYIRTEKIDLFPLFLLLHILPFKPGLHAKLLQ